MNVSTRVCVLDEYTFVFKIKGLQKNPDKYFMNKSSIKIGTYSTAKITLTKNGFSVTLPMSSDSIKQWYLIYSKDSKDRDNKIDVLSQMVGYLNNPMKESDS